MPQIEHSFFYDRVGFSLIASAGGTELGGVSSRRRLLLYDVSWMRLRCVVTIGSPVCRITTSMDEGANWQTLIDCSGEETDWMPIPFGLIGQEPLARALLVGDGLATATVQAVVLSVR